MQGNSNSRQPNYCSINNRAKDWPDKICQTSSKKRQSIHQVASENPEKGQEKTANFQEESTVGIKSPIPDSIQEPRDARLTLYHKTTATAVIEQPEVLYCSLGTALCARHSKRTAWACVVAGLGNVCEDMRSAETTHSSFSVHTDWRETYYTYQRVLQVKDLVAWHSSARLMTWRQVRWPLRER